MSNERITLKAVLLDRDGVLNEEPGPPLSPEEFIWTEGSLEAVVQLNQLVPKVMVVTNQAAIARGKLSVRSLESITQKMQQDLESRGGRIDQLYFCPHHPDWENGQKRKISKACSCRKPEAGMLFKAASEHDFTQQEAVLIGDKTSDFEAAFRFGCQSVGVRTGQAGKDEVCEREPMWWAENLAEAVVRLKHELVQYRRIPAKC